MIWLALFLVATVNIFAQVLHLYRACYAGITASVVSLLGYFEAFSRDKFQLVQYEQGMGNAEVKHHLL